MSDLDPRVASAFEDGVVKALCASGVAEVRLVDSERAQRFTPEKFARWLRGELMGFTEEEFDNAIDELVADGRIERRANPLTGEEVFKLAEDSWR